MRTSRWITHWWKQHGSMPVLSPQTEKWHGTSWNNGQQKGWLWKLNFNEFHMIHHCHPLSNDLPTVATADVTGIIPKWRPTSSSPFRFTSRFTHILYIYIPRSIGYPNMYYCLNSAYGSSIFLWLVNPPFPCPMAAKVLMSRDAVQMTWRQKARAREFHSPDVQVVF